MKTWILAGALAGLAACAGPDGRSVTRDDAPDPGVTAPGGEAGQLVLREPYRTFRDAKETQVYGEPRFAVYNEQGRQVWSAATWHGEEDARVTLPAGRYRVKAAEPMGDDDRDELWVTIEPNGKTVVDLDSMEEAGDALVE